MTVVAGGVRIQIDTDHDNGAVRFLGARPKGDVFVSVEEVHLGAGPIRIDQTVHRYSGAGRFLTAARRDLAGTQYARVDDPFAVRGEQVLELSTAPTT